MVDLDDRALAPPGWSALRPPAIAQPEDRTIYELHVRDFSIGDATVPAAERGTYLAFTRGDSAGMPHLRRLADAGLNTVHLLPAFDIATIEERRAEQATPACDLASYAPDSEEQQDCVDDVRARDGFNWGYDPLHYTAPEGSYATDPEGPRRTLEFRRMVAGPQRRRPPGRHGRRLQPHRRGGAGRQVGARPDRARLLPPAQRHAAASRTRRAAPTPRPSTR